MNRKNILTIIALAMFSGSVVAQDNDGVLQKLDVRAHSAWRNYIKKAGSTRGVVAPDTLRLLVSTTDADLAAEEIRSLGGVAHVIDNGLLTLRLPVSQLERVARLKSVTAINGVRRASLKMETTRRLTGVNDIRKDESFETPFTGKGVVVGVIDQGFQYNHIAFKDASKNSRIKALWEMQYKEEPVYYSGFPDGFDEIEDTQGHATHVTNIAAGSVISGNNFGGIAPEADIVMVPNMFYDDDILRGAKFIKETAEKAGEPWVINMSFGSPLGPHDGTTPYDVSMNNLMGNGGIMVGAMGNEKADRQHVSVSLEKAGDVKYLIVDPEESVACDIWGSETDGKQHFKVTPMLYNKNTGTFREIPVEKMGDGVCGGGVASYNKRYGYEMMADLSSIASVILGANKMGDYKMVFKLEALTDNAAVHAWSYDGAFVSYNGVGVNGDGYYSVCEMAASIPDAIAVGAYTGSKSWNTYEGYFYKSQAETVGDVASFSNAGPFLGSVPKPDVVAPGVSVRSALCAYSPVYTSGSELSKDDPYVVGAVDDNGKQITYSGFKNTKNFYGVMSGTSMATPVVTGIIALWLQANPTLTPAQVKEIIRETSVRDSYTGGKDVEWTTTAGYGKIDAYAGLKKALQMGDATGIGQTMSNEQPVSVSKGEDVWRILFNTPEPQADVALLDLQGKVVYAQRLSGIYQGQDFSLPLVSFAKGIYVLRITTQKAVKVFKLQVK